jgi:diguanylate cyclase (GGDEF)-like protein
MADHILVRLQMKGYHVLTITRLPAVIGLIYSDPPDIVIIDITELDSDRSEIITRLKSDCFFTAIPVIGLVSEYGAESLDWQNYPLDDFVSQPVNFSELFTRINLSLQRIQRVFDNNPLTKLPGNTSIQQAIENAIGQPMAVCYIDINHFKPYNDIYGFSHGDEVLRMVARIMSNAVIESGGGFAGHIGGDDFVFIVSMERAEAVSKTIIDNFRIISNELFSEKVKSDGYYVARNRKDEEEKINLLGLAIAIVPTEPPKIQHYGKVAEVAAELKKKAKKAGESCYVIDRRKE